MKSYKMKTMTECALLFFISDGCHFEACFTFQTCSFSDRHFRSLRPNPNTSLEPEILPLVLYKKKKVNKIISQKG